LTRGRLVGDHRAREGDPMAHEFFAPVQALLALGDPMDDDYDGQLTAIAHFEDTPEHVADLIRLAHADDLTEPPASFGPGHAVAVLTSLRSVEALDALAPLLATADAHLLEELEHMYLQLPEASIRALGSYLAGATGSEEHHGHCLAAAFLGAIAAHEGRWRPQALAPLLTQLGRPMPHLNAEVIDVLTTVEAREALPAIEAALAAGRVDREVWPDLDEVLAVMNDRPATDFRILPPAERAPKSNDGAKARARRKAAKAARKKNRKKK
jgi:hypothetical protein